MKTIIFSFLILLGASFDVFAQEMQENQAQPDQELEQAIAGFRSTQLPLPRFVSLRSNEVNMRSGPARRYPIKWVYQKKGLPVEIVQEFEHWRKVKDSDGETGWIHKSLLSGERNIILRHQEDYVPVYQSKDPDSKIAAHVENGVIAGVKECIELQCRIDLGAYKGWISKEFLWGVYDSENFD